MPCGAGEWRVGMYGQPIRVTILNEAGTPKDVSAYTIREICFSAPRGGTTFVALTADVSFVTDGTDGQLEYVPEDGDIDIDGMWQVQGRVSDGSTENFFSTVADFPVHSNVFPEA